VPPKVEKYEISNAFLSAIKRTYTKFNKKKKKPTNKLTKKYIAAAC